MLAADRAELYAAFADALATPPGWMSLPGREWPLFELATRLLPGSPALVGLSTLPDESRSKRQARYEALFVGNGRPRFWLHESGYINGRILGDEAFAVARFYKCAALEAGSAELPDHVSLELAFLSYLAGRGERETEQAFLDQHVLRWLPALAHSLAVCKDPLYGAIGRLLADFLQRIAAPSLSGRKYEDLTAQIPALALKESCTFCGFCIQRCSVGALFIDETETTTSLMLNASKCNGCGRCALACQDGLLVMESVPGDGHPQVLFESDRVPCSMCGAPTVSRAEINYLIRKIGRPAWLEMCLACRAVVPLGGAQ